MEFRKEDEVRSLCVINMALFSFLLKNKKSSQFETAK